MSELTATQVHLKTQDEAKRILTWIRNRPTLHEEAMGMALCAKNAPEPHVRARAQKRFDDIYAYAAEQLGIKL